MTAVDHPTPEVRPRGCHSAVASAWTFHTWPLGNETPALTPCACGRALYVGIGLGVITLDDPTSRRLGQGDPPPPRHWPPR